MINYDSPQALPVKPPLLLRMFVDPRNFQILFLSLFLSLGLYTQFLDINFEYCSAYFSGVLLTQAVIDKWQKKAWNWKSALITGLSLSLLLRVPTLTIAVLLAIIAIASKALLNIRKRHVFNPANLAIVVGVICFDGWISPGQWGHQPWLIFCFVGLGFVVSTRAARRDVAILFLISFISLIAIRTIYLGDPWSILAHQFNNGALLLFAFFMITDPRTSPDHAIARAIYAVAIAVISYVLQYYWFVPQAMLYALLIACVFVPLLNDVFKAASYQWPGVNVFTMKRTSNK